MRGGVLPVYEHAELHGRPRHPTKKPRQLFILFFPIGIDVCQHHGRRLLTFEPIDAVESKPAIGEHLIATSIVIACEFGQGHVMNALDVIEDTALEATTSEYHDVFVLKSLTHEIGNDLSNNNRLLSRILITVHVDVETG